jgi:hypothetical protein
LTPQPQRPANPKGAATTPAIRSTSANGPPGSAAFRQLTVCLNRKSNIGPPFSAEIGGGMQSAINAIQ